MPDIWVYDIETSPNLVYSWGLWDQNISLNQIVETQDILCFAATKVGSKRIESHAAWDGYDSMIARLHQIMDEADVLVGYNHVAYDNKHVKTAIIRAGLKPPSPFLNYDLMRVVKRNFKFQSYKLAHVCEQFGLDLKSDPGGFGTWRQILEGEGAARDKARNRMVKYCRNDTKITAQLLHKLKPWDKQLDLWLNAGDGTHEPLRCNRCVQCPGCDGFKIRRKGFFYRPSGRRYQRFYCNCCGGWETARQPEPLANKELLRNA